MAENKIIVLAGSNLFRMGIVLGFGTASGALISFAFYSGAGWLAGKITEKFS